MITIKRLLGIFLVLIIVLSLIPKLGSHIRSSRNKNMISKIVRDNLDFLNHSIKDGSYKEGIEIEGIKDIHYFKSYKGSTY
ncbi:MAG: hypothetical protein GXZ06_08525 [Tissierellia bacterium]|nr:hypothetical protein [Tissierellia bacterium]